MSARSDLYRNLIRLLYGLDADPLKTCRWCQTT